MLKRMRLAGQNLVIANGNGQPSGAATRSCFPWFWITILVVGLALSSCFGLLQPNPDSPAKERGDTIAATNQDKSFAARTATFIYPYSVSWMCFGGADPSVERRVVDTTTTLVLESSSTSLPVTLPTALEIGRPVGDMGYPYGPMLAPSKQLALVWANEFGSKGVIDCWILLYSVDSTNARTTRLVRRSARSILAAIESGDFGEPYSAEPEQIDDDGTVVLVIRAFDSAEAMARWRTEGYVSGGNVLIVKLSDDLATAQLLSRMPGEYRDGRADSAELTHWLALEPEPGKVPGEHDRVAECVQSEDGSALLLMLDSWSRSLIIGTAPESGTVTCITPVDRKLLRQIHGFSWRSFE